MKDWKTRLIEEYDQLVGRIVKLRLFLDSHSPTDIQGYDLMWCQYHAMQAYQRALLGRMKLYGLVKE